MKPFNAQTIQNKYARSTFRPRILLMIQSMKMRSGDPAGQLMPLCESLRALTPDLAPWDTSVLSTINAYVEHILNEEHINVFELGLLVQAGGVSSTDKSRWTREDHKKHDLHKHLMLTRF